MATRRFFQAAARVAEFTARVPDHTTPVRDGGDQPYEVRSLDTPLLTVAHVAERLAIPVKSVYEAIYHHGLPVRLHRHHHREAPIRARGC